MGRDKPREGLPRNDPIIHVNANGERYVELNKDRQGTPVHSTSQQPRQCLEVHGQRLERSDNENAHRTVPTAGTSEEESRSCSSTGRGRLTSMHEGRLQTT
ncbi:hypothetical protein ACOSQ4_031523 [Xanthoceras sorbifolium]